LRDTTDVTELISYAIELAAIAGPGPMARYRPLPSNELLARQGWESSLSYMLS